MSERRPAVRKVVLALLAVMLASHLPAVTGPLDACHSPLTRDLQRYLVEKIFYNGDVTYRHASVKYGQLRDDPAWRKYMDGLARVDSARVRAASRDDRKAFWINTYNAMVLDLVARNYPIQGEKTIRSIPRVWDQERAVAGSFVTLRQVEQRLNAMDDPRIVFALTKAAQSSPALSAHAVVPAQIDEQLEWAANSFLADPGNYRLDRGANQIHLSAVFEMDSAVFVRAAMDVPTELRSYPPAERAMLTFVVPRLSSEDRHYILSRHPRVIYGAFNWSLNDAP